MMGAELFAKLVEMEKDYVSLFSVSEEKKDKIRFTDHQLPTMYNHNFVHCKSEEGFVEFVNNELSSKETRDKGFLRVETLFSINEEDMLKFHVKPTMNKYIFLHIETRRHSELRGNSDCHIVEAIDSKIMKDGIYMDIEANKKDLGVDFAKRRIERKASVYKDENKNLQFFVCYHHGTPVGNIEYMALNSIVKLEDFDVLEAYQRRGFGTSILKFLLEKAHNENVEDLYLIADDSDTAKEMYEKCGFEKLGEKTELLFFLKN
ncbi:GNAT family N-acetyltransferase [Saliterribacillus persicus]|uniref:Spore maturation protein CgeE n=1 Tax=Saliterribacillus persicus TaxID=930114 RepID=A0A368Y3T0_9BACI|nr:GNAT family N-acetyltransferase [Saliterribacillus persicus]RCW74950.1 spore maturation protein CgeE [Saliterribacillus persicus]